jgi:hypothetical protein
MLTPNASKSAPGAQPGVYSAPAVRLAYLASVHVPNLRRPCTPIGGPRDQRLHVLPAQPPTRVLRGA